MKRVARRTALGGQPHVGLPAIGRAAHALDQTQTLQRIERRHHRRFEHADAIGDLALREPFFFPELAQDIVLRQRDAVWFEPHGQIAQDPPRGIAEQIADAVVRIRVEPTARAHYNGAPPGFVTPLNVASAAFQRIMIAVFSERPR